MRFLATCLLAVLVGCSGPTGGPPSVLEFHVQNDSGVTGTATLSSAGEDRTLVEIVVDPNGHPDMPAHIHPGTCADMVPQPRFPLESVRDGTSNTEIPISMAELAGETVAINLHYSNDQMQTSVACVDMN